MITGAEMPVAPANYYELSDELIVLASPLPALLPHRIPTSPFRVQSSTPTGKARVRMPPSIVMVLPCQRAEMAHSACGGTWHFRISDIETARLIDIITKSNANNILKPWPITIATT